MVERYVTIVKGGAQKNRGRCANHEALCPHGPAEMVFRAGMEEFFITTMLREASFLAQLAHESGELRYMEEIASGARYEGRIDLGNTQRGDGRRFKGRGPIQLTGRANYAR